MNRDTIRSYQKRLLKMSPKQFVEEMNILHTKAYKLAEKHFIEAMEIELQPKQRNAVIDRTKRIREEWDGIYEVSIE
ncbi:hypothetical protein [Paenibacillus ehimensis]|uniref:Uncharacterized protein n=1 Tax=Paenibacillus ehimensis TaxID=79264 RepID=A0ABT8VFF3_9BACL|nr:hypothetical protein [Paenibacillus ehimensis]MDO3679678.1 hypothetical protein [Paenibacillus ehimensis]MEC0211867.1 hypothetical protein [Paenibacillus ehimensis]